MGLNETAGLVFRDANRIGFRNLGLTHDVSMFIHLPAAPDGRIYVGGLLDPTIGWFSTGRFIYEPDSEILWRELNILGLIFWTQWKYMFSRVPAIMHHLSIDTIKRAISGEDWQSYAYISVCL